MLNVILVAKGRWFFLMITVQFVAPGVTKAKRSSISSFGSYHHWPNKTLDGNVSQNHQACLHTALLNVTKARLRFDLQTVRSIKSVHSGKRRKESVIFWLTLTSHFFHPSVRSNINMPGWKKIYILIKPCPKIFFHP